MYKRLLVLLACLFLSTPIWAQTQTFPNYLKSLPLASTPLGGGEIVYVLQGGVSKQSTVSNIFTASGNLIPVANGGTGITSATANGLLFGNGTSGFGVTSAGINGQLLLGVTGAPPQMSTLSQDCTIATNGVITCTKTNNVAFGPLATQAIPCTIAQGCTGQTTQQAALNAIAPTPTRAGDIIYYNGTNWVSLAGNNSGTQLLQENSSGVPSWATVAGSGTVTSVTCNGVTITTSGTCAEDFDFKNCSLAASVGSSLLTVALKDNTGADPTAASPCRIAFRNATAATGSWTIDTVTSATSINTNAIGATLGSVNSTAFRFWVVAFENSGTVVLGLYNATNPLASCKPIDETQVQSSTAISGSATSVQTYYTPNGITVTSKPVKILGFVEYNSSGLAIAGTYTSGPNFINTFSRGMKKPCDMVQGPIFKTDTAQGTIVSGSTTKVECTGMNATITPTSAANLIIVREYVPWVQTNTNAQQGAVQIGRNSNATMIGNAAVGGYNGVASSNGLNGVALMALDYPNTTSSTVYRVFVFGTGSVTNAFTCFDSATLPFASEVSEIMG